MLLRVLHLKQLGCAILVFIISCKLSYWTRNNSDSHDSFKKPQSKFRLNVMDAPPWSRWASSKFLVLELYRPVGENERRVRGKRKWQDTSSWMLFTRSSLQAYPALHLRVFLRLTRAFLHPPEKRKKIKPVPQAEMPLWKEHFLALWKRQVNEWISLRVTLNLK